MKQLNWYQIFGKSNIPDGRTVLPTDDIQILLNCANIWDKAYTTLAELLADTDTLLAVISSNNAIDYLVRSTTWAVAQALVPTMTSNTTPEGECFAGQGMSASEPAWKAFDGLTTTRAGASAGATELSVGYKPVNPIKPYKAYIWSAYSGNYQYKVQYSDNGSTWTDACSYVVVTDSNPYISLSVDDQHSYWRIIRKWSSADSGIVRELQFYSASITDSADAMTYIGLNNYASNALLADATWRNAICNSEYFESVLNVKVPTMTSYNTPSGYLVSARTEVNTNRAAWKAFDNDTSTYYCSAATGSTQEEYLDFEFPDAVKIYKVVGYVVSGSAGVSIYTQFEYYADGAFEVIDGTQKTISTSAMTKTYDFATNVNTNKMRVKCTGGSTTKYFQVHEIQYYGRKDV